jgi:hypothetical protein
LLDIACSGWPKGQPFSFAGFAAPDVTRSALINPEKLDIWSTKAHDLRNRAFEARHPQANC